MKIAKHLLTLTGLLTSLAAGAQPSAPAAIAAPMRPLQWGQLNFLQTTDTHGWHAGHLQEAQYSADWGDYISFAEQMKKQADDKGVDLLLVDTGDRIEGNGLYDASDPKGQYTYDIFREQHIDIICTGNHELYKADAAAREYDQTVPNFNGNYLASNLDYINPKTGEQIPMAKRYRKFTTKNQGIKVVAFGFLFDFNRNANNTVVQEVEKTIKEEWFQQAIREDADLFVVIGHVTLDGPEYKAIYKALRDQNWDTPIQFFGGHSHIRSYAKYDSKAYGIQSGRYMETVGWMSIEGIKKDEKEKIPQEKHTSSAQATEVAERTSMSFQRRYIDNNLFGYHFHTGLNDTTFPTEHGKNVSNSIAKARKALNLDHNFGCAPKDLWMSRAKYPSKDSLFSWLGDEVMPDVVYRLDRKDVPTIAITNTGAMRFDIFKGAFTRDTTFIISPFVSKFLYIKDVPIAAAEQVLPLLNSGGNIFLSSNLDINNLAPPEHLSYKTDILAPSIPISDLSPPSNAQSPLFSSSSTQKPELIPGYTTKDDNGSDGDDTIHSPITFHRVPNCIESRINIPSINSNPETVDLVFIDFIKPWILVALRFSGADYTDEDVNSYRNETLTELMAGWIKDNWGQDC
ncbi:putative ser thr protein phosphatase family protein [Botrytis fragariae]|uniref:Putative ser thr protein phosphatase family protein n=1 Tax=Botrytis fragariae TaxID=1964551 RepID=A0A8H6EM50_9HELO|nr:putative ser thr protein phosphatase family protein [Botrytis fragariae]KAF5877366.1 putative ser thr protein phosphatase family protein [Botrytis fragariae]